MLHVNHPQHVNLVVSHVHHIHYIHISTVINEVIGLLAKNLTVNKQEKAYIYAAAEAVAETVRDG